ncbi:MAG TPA: histidinol-phosphatase HisJ family protein [Spirochaetota bacterium]|nr:histidinol-phosphatase HisJ family protein [Spirochaetota bacterium]HPI90428.1 histidinol-phosphatase HisJ family protein [Spirochaetota bacterium]HPR46554.1 histidinol-phosphatase HisJ family protein [Spirochaetota bacterium]
MVNYHIHTPRCGHASGAPEEYIEGAIKAGLREIGFSDHAPIPLPMREGITMEPGETESYLAEIITLKDRYKNKIAVRVGFEVDYPLFDTFDRSYLSDGRIDYLTGSCHFIKGWAFDHPDQIDGFKKRNINDIYTDYYSSVEDLARSGMFNIVGHFDLIKKFGHRPTADFAQTIHTIALILARNSTAAEINTSGLLKPVAEMYPSEKILGIFFENNVPVTIGTDAHEPGNVAYKINEAVALLKKTGYRKISTFQGRRRREIDL